VPAVCGIAGIVILNENATVDHGRLVKRMCSTLRHRGPDDEAYFTEGSLSLGMTRLAILDRRQGLYPVTNENGTVCLFYNGEIYNYRELADELSSLGHKFRTRTDAEAIVHAYEEWGDDCIRRFNGMWAFALYDKEKTRLLLARDHFGIKPLYFIKNNEFFLFSSEIRALLCLEFTTREPNERVIHTYLTDGHVDLTEQTFFQDIQRLMPGNYMTLSNRELRIHQYWQMPRISSAISTAEDLDTTARHVRDLFIDSVRRRLVSDVPVGSCLSGGLDSSSIACVVSMLKEEDKKSVGGRLREFFAGYPDDPIDESSFAKLAVSETGSVMHTVFPTSVEFWQDLPELVSTQEEPFVSTSIYAQWRVMQLARREGVTVLLDGQGGDELFAGYPEHIASYILFLLRRRRIFLAMKEIFSSLDQLIPLIPTALARRSSMRKIADCMDEEFAARFSQDTGRFQAFADLPTLLWNDTVKFILPSLLRYEDKNSMHFSIETRPPFLDPRLAEFVASIPLNFKIRGGWTKHIFREAMRDMLPTKIRLRRGKVGFATPQYRWLFRELSDQVRSLLTSDWKTARFVKKSRILELFEVAREGKVTRWEAEFLWRCMNLELWMRQFMAET
jgi:asparagine synthase (glutamine-hydrolysing)